MRITTTNLEIYLNGVPRAFLFFFIRWSQCAEMPEARAFHSMLSFKQRLYTIAGAALGVKKERKSTSLSSLIVLDSKSQCWRPLGHLKEPRHGHSIAFIGTLPLYKIHYIFRQCHYYGIIPCIHFACALPQEIS